MSHQRHLRGRASNPRSAPGMVRARNGQSAQRTDRRRSHNRGMAQESGAPCRTRTCDLLVRSQLVWTPIVEQRGAPFRSHDRVSRSSAITWETHSRSTLPLIRRNLWVGCPSGWSQSWSQVAAGSSNRLRRRVSRWTIYGCFDPSADRCLSEARRGGRGRKGIPFRFHRGPNARSSQSSGSLSCLHMTMRARNPLTCNHRQTPFRSWERECEH